MAINRPAQPVRYVVIVWRKRRIHPGDHVPRSYTSAASQGRHGGNGSRRGRGKKRPEGDERGDQIASPDRPQRWDGDDHMDDGCESEDSSGSEYDADLFEPDEPPPPPLDPAFAPVVQSLTDEALDRFFSASPVRPPFSSSRASPQQQQQQQQQQHHHHYHYGSVSPTTTTTTTTTTPTNTYACPYYVRDPTTYAPCRPRICGGGGGSGGFFPRLLDLRRHLHTAHGRPPWCPACGARFARAAARDDHVRAFACCAHGAPLVAAAPPPGLGEPQLRRLARRPDPAVPAPEQWAALWRLCFGDGHEIPPPPPPPADVIVVARARAFWARHRRAIVAPGGPAAAALAAAGRAALEVAVLERMLATLLRDAGGEARTAGLEPSEYARVGAAL